jgi:TetR/AcrR family acrAB operon transcriptional repressor
MRRTKVQTEETRRQILDAARAVFARDGVARTTLERIAEAAGVTRGAIYWHFANKIELFAAMREQVHVPLIDQTDFALLQRSGDEDPLEGVERFIRTLVEGVLGDERTRTTLEILSLKCEYVDAFAHERSRQSEQFEALTRKLGARYEAARRAGTLAPELTPEFAALDTTIFVVGLLRLALLCEGARLTRSRVRKLIAAHVAARRRGRR